MSQSASRPPRLVVRLGQTSPQKVGAVVQCCRELVDLFRPTAE